jgi:mannose-6-phosphate isomerase-like protein (cupin superfamily)
VLKQRAGMAHVRYTPAHPAPGAPGATGAPSWLAGAGNADTVWLASEQSGTAEHVTGGGLLGAFDTWLDPGSAIGWHVHDESEEMYVLIAGGLTVRAGASPAQASEFDLAPGDVHRIPHTWSHAALAGPAGARLLVVEWRVNPPG